MCSACGGIVSCCIGYIPLGCASFVFFKQKTAYEMRISDWSSDVCSSDLGLGDNINLLINKDDIPSRLIAQNQWPSHYPFIVVTPQLKRDPSVDRKSVV